MTMLFIPAGRFTRREEPDSVVQTVMLTQSFLLADREVSSAQYEMFIVDPNYPDTEKPQAFAGANSEYSPTTSHPVQQVSWNDTVLFCNWLSHKEGRMAAYERTGETGTVRDEKIDAWRLLPDSDGYRLPTEAEWEYACRAGTRTAYSCGDTELLLDRCAVYRANRTEPVGSKLPNCWGVFDMHGNVFEWCQDWFREIDYRNPVTDPVATGAVAPFDRITRLSH